MVDSRDGLLTDDGGFTCSHGRGGYGFGVSGPLSLSLLPRGAVVSIYLTGKSTHFSMAISSKSTLTGNTLYYNGNNHATFFYNSCIGSVNSNDYTYGPFARHTISGGPFTAVLTLCGFDRTVSFFVNGVPQDGVWALPATEAFYLMLVTTHDSGNNIAVTDVTVTMADFA